MSPGVRPFSHWSFLWWENRPSLLAGTGSAGYPFAPICSLAAGSISLVPGLGGLYLSGFIGLHRWAVVSPSASGGWAWRVSRVGLGVRAREPPCHLGEGSVLGGSRVCTGISSVLWVFSLRAWWMGRLLLVFCHFSLVKQLLTPALSSLPLVFGVVSLPGPWFWPGGWSVTSLLLRQAGRR